MASLTLTACKTTQFTYGDGLCIDMGKRCNGVPECKEKTDELECKVADIDSRYNKRKAKK